MGAGFGRHRKSIGCPDRLRDCRQGVRAFCEDAGCGTDGPRSIELRMAGTDVEKLDDGIADGAQEVIEGQRGRLHGCEFCKRAGLQT